MFRVPFLTLSLPDHGGLPKLKSWTICGLGKAKRSLSFSHCVTLLVQLTLPFQKAQYWQHVVRQALSRAILMVPLQQEYWLVVIHREFAQVHECHTF